jgi:hypothetical protein
MRQEPLEVLALGDDGDAFLGDGQAAGQVGGAVPADVEAWGDLDVLVDDRAANPRVPADLDAVEEDRILDQREAVDPDARREDAPVDLASGDDRPLADDRVERRTPAVRVGVDELGRGVGRLVGVDRPVAVVQVQDR